MIMKNGNSHSALLQGMVENNLLTFNPVGDENALHIGNFEDIREI